MTATVLDTAIPWTGREDALLRAHYVTDGAAAVAAMTHRSIAGVCHRAARLRVLRLRRWTAAEDKRLRLEWGECSLSKMAKRLGRTRATTYQRAKILGLSLGCPGGYEYLTDAAVRTGYCTGQLTKILRWAGVKRHRTLSRTNAIVRPCHYVIPFDVDTAVAKWHRTEAVETAAKTRGIGGYALRSWLRKARLAGMNVPAEPCRSHAHWRVESEVIDEVVALHARTETMRRAAMRLGVCAATLGIWLRDAGVPRGTEKLWRLAPEVFDAAARRAVSKKTCRAMRLRKAWATVDGERRVA